MASILDTLATCYASAAAGRRGALRDFLIDYEELLRQAGARDGDARELAETELARAAAESAGLLEIDRQPRSGLPERVRVARAGGEAWLFARAGLAAPVAARERLAACFREARLTPVPARWAVGWNGWLERLAAAALTGGPVAPFRRGDDAGTRGLLAAVAGVLNWQGESLVPYASAVICGDSKRLKILEGRITQALAALTGEPRGLDSFGIVEKPRAVWCHGPLVLEFADGAVLDLSRLPGAVAVSEANLDAVVVVRTAAATCLTVENEAVFLELVKRNPGVLLIWTSFAGSGVMKLLDRLPAAMEFRHFGDTDPAGFDILRDLRERGGRPFLPLRMVPDSAPGTPPFDERERQTLRRLVDLPQMADLREALAAYLAGGVKGRFEQELVPLAEVVGILAGSAGSP